jgi:hypothetical protein
MEMDCLTPYRLCAVTRAVAGRVFDVRVYRRRFEADLRFRRKPTAVGVAVCRGAVWVEVVPGTIASWWAVGRPMCGR